MPEDIDQEGVICFIQNLPIQTSPEEYGLNENAGMAKDNMETLQVCIICFSGYFLYFSSLILIILFCKHNSSLTYIFTLLIICCKYNAIAAFCC
jgi:hypothetical protein